MPGGLLECAAVSSAAKPCRMRRSMVLPHVQRVPGDRRVGAGALLVVLLQQRRRRMPWTRNSGSPTSSAPGRPATPLARRAAPREPQLLAPAQVRHDAGHHHQRRDRHHHAAASSSDSPSHFSRTMPRCRSNRPAARCARRRCGQGGFSSRPSRTVPPGALGNGGGTLWHAGPSARRPRESCAAGPPCRPSRAAVVLAWAVLVVARFEIALGAFGTPSLFDRPTAARSSSTARTRPAATSSRPGAAAASAPTRRP